MAVANPIPVGRLPKAFATRATAQTRRSLIALNTMSRNYEAQLSGVRSVDIPTLTVDSKPGAQTRGGEFPARGSFAQTNQTMAMNDGETSVIPIEIESIDDSNLPFVNTIRQRQTYDMVQVVEADIWDYIGGLTFASGQTIEVGDATNHLDPTTGKPAGTGAKLFRDAVRDGQLYFQQNDLLSPTGAQGSDTINVNQLSSLVARPEVLKNLVDLLEDEGSPVSRDLAAQHGGIYAQGAYQGRYRNTRLFSASALPQSKAAATDWDCYLYTREAVEIAVRPNKIWLREPVHTGGTFMELVNNVRWARLRVNALHIVKISISAGA